MQLNENEKATVLAALRMFQRHYRDQVLAGQSRTKRCSEPSDRFQIHQTATKSEAAAIRAAAGNGASAEGL